jgi:glycogen operon protein
VTVSVSRLERGRPGPFGARVDGNGVNFAVFSEHAEAIELCLYDARGERETARLALHRSGDVWHGRLPGAGAGVVYGLRAHGLWRPDEGHRFNAHKLLLDPYAHEIVGRYEWRAEHFAGDAEGRIDTRDNGAHALKARVVADTFDWGEDRAPRTPLADTLLYELHVKGFTRLHSSVPEALRGTYAGLASDAAIAHLRRLGVSAVSLLPVQQHLDEQRLVTQGLSNYWGYNTIGYFAPEPRYASDGTAAAARADFRAMVRRLHAAGLEVIVDVVYNHTAETDELGPTISWRGLDNRSWYRLQPGRPALYENMSGCGNTLDLRHPRVLQMVLDSLRHWVDEYHVDGFRFDLATALGRGDHRYDARAAFFQAVAQDPLLAPVKLIAEPWDVGAGGYQLGRFPSDWLEWNDKFRDAARDFWLTGRASAGEFAQRLSASSDLFRHGRRAPGASVNYVASHDGFTLRDAVSHEHRHNQANGEHNRDGHAHNRSWNCGVEGDTDDTAVLALRSRLQRALLATLLLSQGTPMLAAGDELGHTQRGNNNPYCQDNATTWIDWTRADEALVAFTAALIALRRERLPLGADWYSGRPDADGHPDLTWRRADGAPLAEDDWRHLPPHAFGALIGRAGRSPRTLAMLFNPQAQPQSFALPPGRWQALADSAQADGRPAPRGAATEGRIDLDARSVVLLAAADGGAAA